MALFEDLCNHNDKNLFWKKVPLEMALKISSLSVLIFHAKTTNVPAATNSYMTLCIELNPQTVCIVNIACLKWLIVECLAPLMRKKSNKYTLHANKITKPQKHLETGNLVFWSF